MRHRMMVKLSDLEFSQVSDLGRAFKCSPTEVFKQMLGSAHASYVIALEELTKQRMAQTTFVDKSDVAKDEVTTNT